MTTQQLNEASQIQRNFHLGILQSAVDGLMYVLERSSYVDFKQNILDDILAVAHGTSLEEIKNTQSGNDILAFARELREVTYDIAIGKDIDYALDGAGWLQEEGRYSVP